MGKIDKVTKEYLQDKRIFADVVNQFLFEGEQVVKPNTLREIDTTETIVYNSKDKITLSEQKYRDIAKLVMTDGNAAYCIVGIENQSYINYAMPIRNMCYDALQLEKQVKDIINSHKNETQKGEFLSGFCKEDRVIPVITLVVFYSSDNWDGALSLKDLYSIQDKRLLKYAPDYKVNLIAPFLMTEEEINQFQTSFRIVMKFLKYAKDKEKLKNVMLSDENFTRVEQSAVNVINTAANLKLKISEKEGEVNMCLAVQEMIEDGIREGRLEGRQEGIREGRQEGELKGTITTYKDFELSFQEAVERVIKKFKLNQEEAKREVKKYW